MVAARILGYGSDYSFEYNGESITVDLTEVEDKPLHKSIAESNKNEFNFILPTSKVEITFKLLTHADEKKIDQELKGLKKLNKGSSPELSTRMKYIITSVNGDFENKNVRKFVDTQLLAIDSRALRNHLFDIQPNVDLSFDYEDRKGNINKVDIPIGLKFFWPDAGV